MNSRKHISALGVFLGADKLEDAGLSPAEYTMNWTTEYPTQPGFYWIKNYTIQRYNRQEFVSDAAIVDVDSSLRAHMEGEDPIYFGRDIISAEWFGPIQPPEENESETP